MAFISSSAYTLAKAGYRVTLIEKNRYAGMETSYANGGQLSASNAEVWTHLSTLVKGLKWMFTKDAPLLMNPMPTWHKLSWMAEFVAAIPRYRDNTEATTRMAIAAREHLTEALEVRPADPELRKALAEIARRAGDAATCTTHLDAVLRQQADDRGARELLEKCATPD